MQQVMGAYRRGEYTVDGDNSVTVGGERLHVGEYELTLAPWNESTSRILPGNNGVVILDIELNETLEAEGIARDIVRLVQESRKKAGLNVADRIALHLVGEPALDGIIDTWQDWIGEQTLATAFSYEHGQHTGRHRLANGTTIDIGVRRSNEGG
jgi:isoleucyl-tRNA synthetase